MTEKPDVWLWKGPAAPLQAIGPDGHALTPGEVIIEVDACRLGQNGDVSRPQSRIEGRVVEAGEDALFFIDRSVALPGVVPCGHQDQCLTGAVQSCPRQDCARSDAPPPHQVVVPTRELALRDERLTDAPAGGPDRSKEG